MKASLSWLKELVDTSMDVAEIAEKLSISGFEVEEEIDLGLKVKGIVVGKVEEVLPHPNADKLKICRVDIGTKKSLQIVCGARNVRDGVHVLVATEGAYLQPINLKIKKSELRGVLSEGMICSLGEIGLESDTDGIEILEDSLLKIPEIGSSPRGILGMDDTILDLAITANRPDGMSMVGLARELSAITDSKLNLPKIKSLVEFKIFEPKDLSEEAISSKEIYSLSYLEGVDGKKKSPLWLKNRLEKAGIRSINAIVDITNYIMLEQGQPLHAFDADKLNILTDKEVTQNDFGVRRAKAKETLLALDNNEYELNHESHVITCCDKAIAVAGIIGGKSSSVNEHTKNIWLEGAVFTSTSIRRSSRKIGIRTDSSSRYEKGISAQITLKAVNRAVELYNDCFKCRVSDGFISKNLTPNNYEIKLRRDRIHNILGALKVTSSNKSGNKRTSIQDPPDNNYTKRNLTDNEIENSLKKVGCEIKCIEEGWKVSVLANRSNDLQREIDLIEEIARLIGYDKFDANLPDPIKPGYLRPKQSLERTIRNCLINNGLQEIVSFSLVPKDETNEQMVAISNPLLTETSHLRTNLWEEHLKVCKRNIDSGKQACWVFEIGNVYTVEKKEIYQKSILSGAITGYRSMELWTNEGKQRDMDYYTARGKITQLTDRLKINVEDRPLRNDERLHPGRSAELILEGKRFGVFGQINPELANKLNINRSTFLFEVSMDAMLEAAARRNKWLRSFKEFATVPHMQRDMAVIVSKEYLAGDIIKKIMKTGTPLLESVELIDRYEGGNIDSGEVSLAFRLTYRKKKETLKETEINPVHDRILKELVQSFKVKPRI
ncbi:phenylalanine--tRNA ligase subunit beta [Prochlorococcus marinus]|uniref:Phenylalanine--tRNA ligase beta subunit n=1 Tax=Prochlorococcus marinus (strain MIT 9211) TaxID=93059 RepID=A9BAG2_PROM4|nr:phenylalanine--tRNA ligase subunit beta [Prochlorococcus marinus]ABX08824.1 Phenylalanyl-tRNA synthetase beta chain [Prochlorococcus marinus str. MIT 9211]